MREEAGNKVGLFLIYNSDKESPGLSAEDNSSLTPIADSVIEREIAASKETGGDQDMSEDHDKYVTHKEMDSAIGSLRREIGLQFDNVHDKINGSKRETILELKNYLSDKFDELRKERKSDKHWTIGIVLTGTSVLIALSSLILGIVLR